jgi:cobalt/nickel transport system permease protein
MHMADALLSPAVGGTMWGASTAAIAFCSNKVRTGMDDRGTPLMGVLGAFIFAVQMINFTIPVTGSSGHLGGGLLLAVLLGPHAAFLTISSVLVVQALFFADGGLLALGCNMFNLGIFPAFIAYPLVYKKIAGSTPSTARISFASIAAAVIGLQLGSLGVVVETVSSGIASLPFSSFAAIMQPIHLAIGIVEGLVTASVISFIFKAKPEIVRGAMEAPGDRAVRAIVPAFLVLAIVTGGFVSWFASKNPDGLEWAVTKVAGKEKPKGPERGVQGALAAFQQNTAFLPDYSFKKPAEIAALIPESGGQRTDEGKSGGGRLGTSISGIVGGMLSLGLSLLIGFMLKRRNGRQDTPLIHNDNPP